ncbi:uncharacterized protein A4U43_C03F28660 [Asparagus officinalis]|uniref:Subtilisin-like protease fibronectin type-III domain-containing protein n=1 Tax=Asparagus officinalis TaxID=4686 RepID=A0A5P1FEL0_ASPOF|nr:uncharacterized protein A4U43_C03F28660 [Asparagus officinalis]
MVTLNDRNDYKVVVTRTVTNVGAPDSMYAVNVTAPVGPTVSVSPEDLVFSEAKENLKFYGDYHWDTEFFGEYGVLSRSYELVVIISFEASLPWNMRKWSSSFSIVNESSLFLD